MGIADALKPSSTAAIRALRQLGLEVVMLMGDNRQTAVAIASDVGELASLLKRMQNN